MSETETVTRWVNNLRPNTGTRQIYPKYLNIFCRWAALTPDELLELARKDPAETSRRLDDWRTGYCEKRGLSGKTIQISLTGIKSFLRYWLRKDVFQIDFPKWIRVTKKYFDFIPSARQVNMLLNRAPLKLQTVLQFVAYAGMRPIDVLNLEWWNIREEMVETEEGLKASKIPLKIVLRQAKTNDVYVTFLPPKGVNILETYLSAKKFTMNTDNNTRLFKYAHSEVICNLFQRIAADVIPKQSNPMKRIRTYSLRKFFRFSASRKLGESIAEYLMGHTQGALSLGPVYNGLKDLYPPAIEQLRQDYATMIPILQGSDEGIISEELIENEKRIHELENQLAKYEKGMDAVNKKLARLETLFNMR
nr:hypothetical protein [Candidatus Freyarchaeota archaeon]